MNNKSASLLDETGWHILEILQEDARISTTELGQRVGLSRSAVTERVKRLEEAGIITGYRAEVNLPAAGFPVVAFIRIRVPAGSTEHVKVVLRSISEVLACHWVTGDDDLIAKVAATSLPHLQKITLNLARQYTVTTLIVMTTLIEHNSLSRDALPGE